MLLHKIKYLIIIILLAGCGQQSNSIVLVTPTAPPPPAPTATLQPTSEPVVVETQPEPTSAETACAETEGTITTASFDSALTGADVRYRIYLPPCYTQTNVRYPYVIMLHGFDVPGGMDDSMWDEIGLDEAADQGYADNSLPPMAIVMPNGNDARHDYDPGPYPQVIAEELIPHVEGTYCLWGTPETRGIGGLSRGGYWAYATAFLHPEQFQRVGGHSAFFYDGDFPQANPSALIGSAQGIESLDMYLDHGAIDTLVNENMLVFVQRAQNRGIEPIYMTDQPGGHTNEYWGSQSPAYLAFYSENWPDTSEGYPSCE